MMGGVLMGAMPGGTPHETHWYHQAPLWEKAVRQTAPLIASAANIVFLPPPTIPFGLTDVGNRSTPTFADLDGDGDLDAFIGELFGSTFYFENTGAASSPAFASVVTNPFGLADVGRNSRPTFADLDGDGDLDAFIGEKYGSTFYFENTGTATSPAFAPVSANPFSLTSVGRENAPAFADLDSDGDLDAFIGELYGTTQYFENTGTATSPAFAPAVTNAFGLTDVGYFNSPVLADLDGDGDFDAFIGDISGNTVYFENSGTASSPAFAPAATNAFGLADVGSYSAPTFADLDGDGDLDASVGKWYGQTFYFENTGTVTNPALASASANPFSLTDVGYDSTPTLADVDGDGDLDAFIGERNGNTFFFENTGTATSPAFVAASANPFGLASVGTRSTITFADVDGDGDLDAFRGEYYGNTQYFENTGTATSPAFAAASANPFGLTDVCRFSAPAFADVDGDGDLDAFIGEYGGSTFYFENTGTATSPAFAPASANPFGLTDVGTWNRPTFVDLDDDGDLDAFVGEYGGNSFYFENTGSAANPAFAPASASPFGLLDVGRLIAPTFADLDGDGDQDFFTGELDGSTFYFENISDAALPVELAAFSALNDEHSLVLQWQTQSETNNAGFEIEHLLETENGWQKDTFVEGAGTTTEPQTYSHRIEGLIPGRYRFRLKQIDFDGSFQYSAEIEVAVAAPVKLVVEQNYPNPFRGSTEITYVLPKSEPVRLVVYDVQGREVVRLVDGSQAAGEHRVSWAAGTLPSGLYVYRLEAGSATETRTMMLVR